MRNLKRALSLALATIMVLSMMVVGAGAVSLDDFSDSEKIVNKEAVTVLTTLNVINGKDDGNYDPEGIVTRAEMAKIICVTLNGGQDPALGNATTHTYTDTVGHWAEAYIEYCTQLGIVAGKGNGTFDPNATVTGTEAAKMLLVALGYNASYEGMVGANWAIATNVLANQNKLYAGAVMNPNDGLSRDNAAQMAYNALNAEMVGYTFALVTGNNGSITSIPAVEKKDDTLLSDKFGGVRVEGVVVRNEQTASNFDGKTRIDITNEDELAKLGHNFGDVATFEMTTDASLLGTSVFFYAVPSVASPTNAEKAVVLGSVMDSGKNVVLTTTGAFDKDASVSSTTTTADIIGDYMDDEDIDVNTTTVVYVDGDAKSRASGASTADYLAANLKNAVGYETKFIDNDSDGITEAVVQTQYFFGKVIRYNDKSDGGLTIDNLTSSKDYKIAKIVGFEDVALNDYVIYNLMGGKLYVEKAETLTGTIESVKVNGNRLKANLTVDGTTYSFTTATYVMDGKLEDPNDYVASNFVGKDITLYLDKFGYVAASTDVNGFTDYAYIANGSHTNLGTGLAGSVTVYAVLPDGTAKSYTVKNLKNGTFDGKPSTYATTTPSADVGTVYDGQLYGYYVASDGQIELTVPTTGYQDTKTSASGGDNVAISFKKGQSTINASGLSDNLVDSSTVFYYVFMKGSVVDHIETYTGKDNAPSVDISAGSAVGEVSTITSDSASDIAEAVVFVTDKVTSGNILYLYQYVRSTGDYTIYNAVIDGELVEGITVDSKTTNLHTMPYAYTVNKDNVYSLQTANTTVHGYVKIADGNSLVINEPGVGDHQLTLNSSTSMAEIDGGDTTIIGGVTEDSWVTVVFDTMNDNAVKGLYLRERYAVDNASIFGVKASPATDVTKNSDGSYTSSNATASNILNDLMFSKSVLSTKIVASKPTTYAAASIAPAVTTLTAGTYYIVALAKDGASFSATELTSTAPPPASATPSIDTQPVVNSSFNGTAGGQVNTTALAASSSAGTLSYQWYKCDDASKSNPVAVSTGYTGATTTQLSADAGTLSAGTEYFFCKVTNTESGKPPVSVDSDVLALTVAEDSATPSIGTQPVVNASFTGSTGGQVNTTALAASSSAGTLSYQWYKCDDASKSNPVAVSTGYTGATTTQLSADASTLSAGTEYFFCTVTNTESGKVPVSVDSDVLTLSVS